MRNPLLLSMALILSGSLLGARAEDATKDKTPLVKKIELKGRLPFQRGRFGQPKVIKTAADLKGLPEAAAKEITKAVNFDKQQVLLFTWAGSGQDKLTAKEDAEKKGSIVFQYRPGLTRDLRSHVQIFAIRKGAKWKIMRQRFRR